MIINMTLNELVYIDDSITLPKREHSVTGNISVETAGMETMRGISGGAIVEAPSSFILKIGGALLELTDEQKSEDKISTSSEKIPTVGIDFSEDEIWIIRELGQISIQIGKEPVGINLKLKAHRALRGLNQLMLEKLNFGEVEAREGMNDEEWKDKLFQWKVKNASANKDTN